MGASLLCRCDGAGIKKKLDGRQLVTYETAHLNIFQFRITPD
jgi:hypothetical protein